MQAFIKNIVDRVEFNYKESGMSNIINKIYAKVMHKLYENKNMIWYLDLMDEKEQEIPSDISIDSYESVSEIPVDVYESFKRHRPTSVLDTQLRERFETGCTLWILLKGGIARCFIWTATGYAPKGFYFPLGRKDVYIFDGETFKEHRGKSFMPIMSRSVLTILKKMNYVRVYYVTQVWNTAMNRMSKKEKYDKLAIARKYHIFGKTITVWSSIKKDTP